MTVSRWRLGIAAGALIVLTAFGGGLVQAASSTRSGPASIDPASAQAAGAATGGAEPAPIVGERLGGILDRLRDGGLGRFRKHLVHGTFTILDRDGAPVTVQLDHGTVSAIGDGSITITEAGGASVSVATTAETRVRKDGKPASLDALAVGDEVVVGSIVDGGSATARRILVPPPVVATPAGSTGS